MSKNRLAVSLPGLELKIQLFQLRAVWFGQEYAKYYDLDVLWLNHD